MAKKNIYEKALSNIDKRNFVFALKGLWNEYTEDKTQLHRTDLVYGQPIFSADRFILWLFEKYK